MSAAPIRVGVLGAKGKVGRAICEAVEAAPDLELVAQVDTGDRIETFVDTRTQVVSISRTPTSSWEIWNSSWPTEFMQ